MSKLAVFFLHACDDYHNSTLIKTRYYVSTDTGLVDTPAGIENSIDLIFETIKRCDLVVQNIIFKDPAPEIDQLKINLPCFLQSGFARIRPMSSNEKEVFCNILHRKMKEMSQKT
jgi:hypothetical protein